MYRFLVLHLNLPPLIRPIVSYNFFTLLLSCLLSLNPIPPRLGLGCRPSEDPGIECWPACPSWPPSIGLLPGSGPDLRVPLPGHLQASVHPGIRTILSCLVFCTLRFRNFYISNKPKTSLNYIILSLVSPSPA